MVVPGHSTPWRAFCDSYFAHHRVTVWKSSRGLGGKSFLLALLGLTEALTLKCDVKILGGSGRQSQEVQDYISQDFYTSRNAPKHLWDGEPLTTISRFIYDNSIEALKASQTSVRGPHVPRLRLDEADEMNLSILDAAMGQTMSVVDQEKREVVVPAQTTISSTHHHPDGTMSEVLRRADQRGWPVHEWSFEESVANGEGWLLPSEVEAKKAEVTQAMWEVEYRLQQPSQEGLAIDRAQVEAMFRPALGTFEGLPGEYIEIRAPEEGARYATGADWAKKQDYTDIWTARTDTEPRLLVAYERRNREPWPRMVGRFDRRLDRYPGKAAHDATGKGDVVGDYTKHDPLGVVMSGRARSELFTDFIVAIEDGRYVAPMIESVYDEFRYATVDQLFGSGHPPDSFVAGAMAHRAVKTKAYTASVGRVGDRERERREQRGRSESDPSPPETLVLRYTGRKSGPVDVGPYRWMLEPGWEKMVDSNLARQVASKFPEYFTVAA